MSQSFYKYLSALLLNYFRHNSIEPGNKYYIIIEDKNRRNSFVKALHDQSSAEDIRISNIYRRLPCDTAKRRWLEW